MIKTPLSRMRLWRAEIVPSASSVVTLRITFATGHELLSTCSLQAHKMWLNVYTGYKVGVHGRDGFTSMRRSALQAIIENLHAVWVNPGY
jgi:hypothetical protein